MARTARLQPDDKRPWSAQLVRRPVAELIPYAGNPRTHSERQVGEIAGSIRRFGFVNPVLVAADGTIVAGHGRVMAAHKLGLEDVPCIVVDHLSPAERRALMIADNRIAENAGWDEEMLAVEMHAINADAPDLLDVTGFDAKERDRFLGEVSDAEVTGGLPDVWAIVVDCADEREQADLLVKLSDMGLTVRAMIG